MKQEKINRLNLYLSKHSETLKISNVEKIDEQHIWYGISAGEFPVGSIEEYQDQFYLHRAQQVMQTWEEPSDLIYVAVPDHCYADEYEAVEAFYQVVVVGYHEWHSLY